MMDNSPSGSLATYLRLGFIALLLIAAILYFIFPPEYGIENDRNGPFYLFSVILIVLLLFIMNAGLGHFIIRKLRLLSECSAYNLALCLTAGFSASAFFTFLALIKTANVNPMLPVGIIAIIVAVIEVFRYPVDLVPKSPSRLKNIKGINTILLAVFAGLSLYALYVALTPPFSWDGLVYHLPIPEKYIENRGFTFLPLKVYANMPHYIELLFMQAMMISGDVAAKVMHFGMGLTLALSLYAFCRRYFSPVAGISAAILFFCHPMVYYLWSVSFIDVALALFFFWSAALIIEWARSGRRNYLVISGLTAGLGMGSKYTMIFAAFACLIIVVSIIMISALKKPRTEFLSENISLKKGWKDVAAFLIPAFVMVLPWLIKNMIYTGNPVYPVLYGILGGHPWSEQQAEWLIDWQHAIGMGRGVLDYILLPVRLFFMSDITKGYSRFAGTLLPWPLILLPAAIFVPKSKRPVLFIFLGVFCIFFVGWAAGAQQVRFFIPGLPLMILCGVMGLSALKKRGPVILYIIAASIVFAAPLHLLVSHIIPEAKREGSYLNVISGRENNREFLRPRMRTFPCMEFIEVNTEPSEMVLYLFEPRTYYSPRPHVADSMLEAAHFFNFALEAGDADRLRDRFEQFGATHVIVDEQIRRGMRRIGENWDYTDPENHHNYVKALEIINRFMEKHLILVFEENDGSVYRFREK